MIRRVWEGTEPDFWSATVSPDGRFVSEIDWETGDLAVTDLLTGELKRVTDKGSWYDKVEWAETSVFSPDGRRLAYTYWNEEASGYEIRVIDLDGSNERTIVPSPGPQFYAMLEDWSDDGRYLLAMLWYEHASMQIGLISVEDGSIRVLKEMEERRGPDVCALSPDGRFMAYDPHRSGESEDHDILAAWSPDGRQLAYVRATAGERNPKLILRSVTGDESREIALAMDRPRRILDWTDDGQAVLIQARDSEGGGWGIFEFDLETGKVENVLHVRDLGENANSRFQFTRDLKTLYFARWDEGFRSSKIVARDRASGRERVIASAKSVSRLSLSPDGKTLALREWDREAGFERLATVSVSGGQIKELRRFDPEEFSDMGISWSSDGRHILFATLDDQANRYSLWRITRTGGEPTRIAELPFGYPPGMSALRFHPDGNRIAFLSGEFRGEIWVVQNLPGTLQITETGSSSAESR